MFYAVAYENGTYRIFSNWPKTERAAKGRGEVRFKKFKTEDQAKGWGQALADWLKRRKSMKAILELENEFDSQILQHDPRVSTLPN